MSDPQNSSAPTGAPAPSPAPAPAPAAPEPIPGSPEHRAAMIAAYDAQFVKPSSAPAAPSPDAAAARSGTEEPPASSNEPAPKLTDETPENTPPKADDKKSEGTAQEADKDKPAGPVTPELLDAFSTGFNQEKLPDNLVDSLVKLGFPKELIEAHHAVHLQGQRALVAAQTQELYKAAGGEAQFKELVTWGQKNLTPEQREFYDAQLNNAATRADAVQVLMSKMNTGKDPSIQMVNAGGTPAVTGYRSQAEVTAAMSDPRYWTDEAYHNDVKAKLRASRF